MLKMAKIVMYICILPQLKIKTQKQNKKRQKEDGSE